MRAISCEPVVVISAFHQCISVEVLSIFSGLPMLSFSPHLGRLYHTAHAYQSERANFESSVQSGAAGT